jgi:hypothetical protein
MPEIGASTIRQIKRGEGTVSVTCHAVPLIECEQRAALDVRERIPHDRVRAERALRELCEIANPFMQLRSTSFAGVTQEQLAGMVTQVSAALQNVKSAFILNTLDVPEPAQRARIVLIEETDIWGAGLSFHQLRGDEIETIRTVAKNVSNRIVTRLSGIRSIGDISQDETFADRLATGLAIDVRRSSFWSRMQDLATGIVDTDRVFSGMTPFGNVFATRTLRRNIAELVEGIDAEQFFNACIQAREKIKIQRESFDRYRNILSELGYNKVDGIGFRVHANPSLEKLEKLGPPDSVDSDIWMQKVATLNAAAQQLIKLGATELEPGAIVMEPENSLEIRDALVAYRKTQDEVLALIFAPLAAMGFATGTDLSNSRDVISKLIQNEISTFFDVKTPLDGSTDALVTRHKQGMAYQALISLVTFLSMSDQNSEHNIRHTLSLTTQELREQLAKCGLRENDDSSHLERPVTQRDGPSAVILEKTYDKIAALFLRREELEAALPLSAVRDRYVQAVEAEAEKILKVKLLKNADSIFWLGLRDALSHVVEDEPFRLFARQLSDASHIEAKDADLDALGSSSKSAACLLLAVDGHVGKMSSTTRHISVCIPTCLEVEANATCLNGVIPQHRLNQARLTGKKIVIGENSERFVLPLTKPVVDLPAYEGFLLGYSDYIGRRISNLLPSRDISALFTVRPVFVQPQALTTS